MRHKRKVNIIDQLLYKWNQDHNFQKFRGTHKIQLLSVTFQYKLHKICFNLSNFVHSTETKTQLCQSDTKFVKLILFFFHLLHAGGSARATSSRPT